MDWRNGYEPKHVQTEAGALELAVPQLRGTDEMFRPTVVDRLRPRTADLESLVRGMYVRGLSTQDVSALYHDTFGANRLSKSTVSRVTRQLNQDFETWRRRDLSDLPVVYLFLDGQYHAARLSPAVPGAQNAEYRREAAATDAIEDESARTSGPRCADVCRRTQARRDLIAKFKDRYPAAMECLERPRRMRYLPAVSGGASPADSYDQPTRASHGESRRRTRVIPRFPTERWCLSLLHASLITASKHWRGIPMTAATLRHLQQLRAVIAEPTKQEAVA